MTGTLRRRFLHGAVVLATALTAIVVTAAPAQAYVDSSLDIYWATQNADTCGKVAVIAPKGYFTVGDGGVASTCAIDSRWGNGPNLSLDSGAQNLRIDIWEGSNFVGYFYFGGYGEKLYTEDPWSDGDSVYLWINGQSYCACSNNYVYPFNLDLPDGSVYSIKLTDDSAGTDVIASSSAGSLPYLHP